MLSASGRVRVYVTVRFDVGRLELQVAGKLIGPGRARSQAALAALIEGQRRTAPPWALA